MPRALAVLLIIAMGHTARAQPAPAPTLAELVRTIDDDPDILHGDYTPAVWALCGRGLDGAEAILPLLEAPSDTTRMHAGTVLACAVARYFRVRPGQGDTAEAGDDRRFAQAWKATGGYDRAAPLVARHAAVLRWQRWITTHRGVAPPPPDHPSTDAIRAAVAPRLATAKACTRATGRVWVDLTFRSSGAITRMRVHGETGAAARCIQRALAPGRVPPFAEASATIAIGVAP